MKIVREDVIAAVRDANVVSDPEKIRDDVNLEDQGIDSLGVFSIILLLQEKYGIEIPDSDIDQLNSVTIIVNYLNRRLA